jgi:hypothetical protein
MRPEVLDKSDLFQCLYYGLWFPGYFGFNWDALDECLRDLSWIRERKVIICHDAMPILSNNDMSIYISILDGAILDHAKNGEKIISIILPKEMMNFKADRRSE